MALPAQRFHKIFVQKIMISFHRSNVNGKLRIWGEKRIKLEKEAVFKFLPDILAVFLDMMNGKRDEETTFFPELHWKLGDH